MSKRWNGFLAVYGISVVIFTFWIVVLGTLGNEIIPYLTKCAEEGPCDLTNLGALMVGVLVTAFIAILILKIQKDHDEKRRNHIERELVHTLAQVRHTLLLINESLLPQMERQIFDYSQIKENWEFLRKAPYDKLDDIIKTADVLDPEITSQITVLKGQFKIDLEQLFDIGSVTIQVGGILQIVNNLLTEQLGKTRLTMISEEQERIDKIEDVHVKTYVNTELNKYRFPEIDD